jgi:alkylated DNA repair dioxygenase AlkB
LWPIGYRSSKILDLFNNTNGNSNLLPFDGEVNYYGEIFSKEDSDYYYDVLMNTIEWKNDEALIYGKKIITKRKVAWYAEQEFKYTYSKVTKTALPWTVELLALKEIAEKLSNETYNSCLLNLYHTGDEGMAWHSDGEADLKKNGAIASLSFGAPRKFAFKHKNTGNKIDVFLEHGSMLVMKGSTQSHWLHRLPPTTKVHTPRINLTFRTIIR